MFGPLSPAVRARVQRFLEDPTEENWDDVCCIMVRPLVTVWQAVRAVDPTFPRTGPSFNIKGKRVGCWKRVPDAMLVARAIQRAVGGEPCTTKT